MKLIVLHLGSKPNFKAGKIDSIVLNAESAKGQNYVSLYGVTKYPAMIVARDDGTLVQLWQGNMPSDAELYHYTNSFI